MRWYYGIKHKTRWCVTKSVNDGKPFIFPMEWEDISSFNLWWDFSTDLHIAASLGQHDDTWALDWNKLEFVKMQGNGFGFLIDVVDAAMCRGDSLQ